MSATAEYAEVVKDFDTLLIEAGDAFWANSSLGENMFDPR